MTNKKSKIVAWRNKSEFEHLCAFEQSIQFKDTSKQASEFACVQNKNNQGSLLSFSFQLKHNERSLTALSLAVNILTREFQAYKNSALGGWRCWRRSGSLPSRVIVYVILHAWALNVGNMRKCMHTCKWPRYVARLRDTHYLYGKCGFVCVVGSTRSYQSTINDEGHKTWH